MGDDRGYWCRCCRRRYVGPLDEWGKPPDWYRVVKPAVMIREAGDLWPGWYCSIDCILVVGMVTIGVDEQAAVAWLRGEEVGVGG
jgi:hypothetical protein